jgi:transcriptional regulator with XRE-family HTH domain
MKIGERIKILRKELNLTQADFGEKIGLKPTAILMYEKGSRNVTGQSIALITQTFNVNEEWLKTGNGTMFVTNDNTLLEKLINEYHMSNAQQQIITAFLHMDDQKREVVSQAFFTFIDALNQTSPTPTSNMTVLNNTSDTDLELKKRQEIIATEFEAEKKGEISSAFTCINGHKGA